MRGQDYAVRCRRLKEIVEILENLDVGVEVQHRICTLSKDVAEKRRLYRRRELNDGVQHGHTRKFSARKDVLRAHYIEMIIRHPWGWIVKNENRKPASWVVREECVREHPCMSHVVARNDCAGMARQRTTAPG